VSQQRRATSLAELIALGICSLTASVRAVERCRRIIHENFRYLQPVMIWLQVALAFWQGTQFFA
jgi:hypothetical protein